MRRLQDFGLLLPGPASGIAVEGELVAISLRFLALERGDTLVMKSDYMKFTDQ